MIFKNKIHTDFIAKSIKLVISDNDGTLTPGHTFYTVNGECQKQYHHRDGRGVYLLKSNNLMFGIVTGENSEIVLRRAEKLNADFVFIGKSDKKEVLSEIKAKYGLDPTEIAYVGDDTNDTEIMQTVGISFAVSDSHPTILNLADVKCTLPGGYGAVREVTDYILNIKEI